MSTCFVLRVNLKTKMIRVIIGFLYSLCFVLRVNLKTKMIRVIIVFLYSLCSITGQAKAERS